jgi:hypothetical protein
MRSSCQVYKYWLLAPGEKFGVRGRLMKLAPVYKRALFRRPIGPQATTLSKPTGIKYRE